MKKSLYASLFLLLPMMLLGFQENKGQAKQFQIIRKEIDDALETFENKKELFKTEVISLFERKEKLARVNGDLNLLNMIKKEKDSFLGTGKEPTIFFITDQKRTLELAKKGLIKIYEKSIKECLKEKLDFEAEGLSKELNDLKNGKATESFVRTRERISKSNLVEIAEISSENPSGPWVSSDGLTMYWQGRDPIIYSSRRETPSSRFVNKKEIVKGRHPTLSKDELEIVFINFGPNSKDTEILYTAKRKSKDENFGIPNVIQELSEEKTPKNPCLSENGLTLFYNRQNQNGTSEIYYVSRLNKSSPWGTPKKLPIQNTFKNGSLTWPYIFNDNKNMICTLEGANVGGKTNFVYWFRENESKPFSDHFFIDTKGVEGVFGRNARYVPSTKELFFTKVITKGQFQIWTLTNLELNK